MKQVNLCRHVFDSGCNFMRVSCQYVTPGILHFILLVTDMTNIAWFVLQCSDGQFDWNLFKEMLGWWFTSIKAPSLYFEQPDWKAEGSAFFFRQHSSCDNIWHIHCLQTGTFILEKAIKSFKSHKSSCICSCTSLRFHVKKKESESQSFIHLNCMYTFWL